MATPSSTPPPQQPAKSPSTKPLDTDPPPGATPRPEGPAARVVLEAGARPVPDYELVERLGHGGFGEVWKAKGASNFTVALKFIRLGDQASEVELRSLEFMKGIRHAHLLSMFGAWQRDDYLIVAMELADGTLLERLNQATAAGQSGVPCAELLEAMREAAKGIDYLNGLGIQHRDIKPHNMLLVGGSVRIADFGLAKVLEQSNLSHSGVMTVPYAAPECFKGQTSSKLDQYSLAVSYCQLRGNRLPFTGSLFELMDAHVNQLPDLRMLFEAERPAVARALAKKPGERWPTCRAFVEALVASILTSPTAPPEPPKPPPASLKLLPIADTVLEAGQRTTIETRVQRQNCPGPLEVRCNGLPKEIEARRVSTPADADAIKLTLQASPQAVAADHAVRLKAVTAGAKAEERFRLTVTRSSSLPREFTNSIGMRLVLIPAGKFLMGSPKDETERGADEEQHEVTLTRPFFLGVHAVTQEQYKRVMGANPSYFSPKDGKNKIKGKDSSRFPVDTVSWEDAVDFCRMLSELSEEKKSKNVYRLPTEAEWEYACREGGSSLTPFHFGASLSSDRANFDGNFPYGGANQGSNLTRTTMVGSYQPNRFGLYDMHGNVWEWCADYYDKDFYKKEEAKVDPENKQKGDNRRVWRGGSWSSSGGYCRAACRLHSAPGSHYYDIGFRVVLDAGVWTP